MSKMLHVCHILERSIDLSIHLSIHIYPSIHIYLSREPPRTVVAALNPILTSIFQTIDSSSYGHDVRET